MWKWKISRQLPQFFFSKSFFASCNWHFHFSGLSCCCFSLWNILRLTAKLEIHGLLTDSFFLSNMIFVSRQSVILKRLFIRNAKRNLRSRFLGNLSLEHLSKHHLSRLILAIAESRKASENELLNTKRQGIFSLEVLFHFLKKCKLLKFWIYHFSSLCWEPSLHFCFKTKLLRSFVPPWSLANILQFHGSKKMIEKLPFGEI